MHKRLFIITVLLILAAVVMSACEFTYDSYTIGCTGLDIYDYVAEPTIKNYDSDGDGIPDQEQVWSYGVDGKGNVLIDETVEYDFGGYFAGAQLTETWTRPPEYNPITFQYIVKSNGYLPEDIIVATFVGECPGLPTWPETKPTTHTFQDGRINRYDAGAPVALYPVSYGARGIGLHIYAIQADSTGKLIMQVTPEQFAAAGGDWELIAANDANTVQVFKYLDRWQVNAAAGQGKTYVVIFDGLSATARVHSYTTDPLY